MREHLGRDKKTTTGFSIPSLKHPVRGFGLDSSEASPQAVPSVQPLNKPPGHDISRISMRPQAKLTVNKPGDIFEQEADSVAQKVMRRLSNNSGNPQTIQRQEAPEDEVELQMKSLSNSTRQRQQVPEDEELHLLPLQRQAEAGMAAAPEVEASINQARGGGQPLAENIREPMEQAFGADFSGVKVHTDGQSDSLNRSIQARAFTTGQDVFFRQGEYNPGSRGGQELLAHELTHVVQQSGGAVQRSLFKSPIGNITATMSEMVQGSWIGDRINWVRTATHEDNWVNSDPPGAYYILNGLSMDDMVRILRALTPADRQKLSDNLEEQGVGCDRPRIHLGLSNAAKGSADTAFRESSENLLWAIRSENYANSPQGAFFLLAAAKGAMGARLLAALNRDALEALIAHSKEADKVPGGANVILAINKKLGSDAKNRAEKAKAKMRAEVLIRLADIINNKQGDLPLTAKARKQLISKIINDLLSASTYDQVEQLTQDVQQRTLVSLYMQQSQKENSKKEKGFSYPNKEQDGTKGVPARVNQAALQYWEPVQKYPGEYFFNLSTTGKKNAYQAIVSLFTGQSNPHLRTLIHCDYLVSLIEYRAWAESIGVELFNKNVELGNIPLVLKWNGFVDLAKPKGLSKPPIVKKETPLKSITVGSEKDFIIGDHVVFYNDPTYVPLTQNTPDVWKLENAIVVSTQGGKHSYQGHGYPYPVLASFLMDALTRKYNQHIQEALNLISAEKKATDETQRNSAAKKRKDKYPNVHPKGSSSGWEIEGFSDLTEKNEKRDLKLLTPQDAPGLKSPRDGNIWVNRPDHNSPD